jgi:hypothetical protein
MHHEQYEAHNQDNVNQPGGYVKCEEAKQPKDDQNRGDYPKHVFISLFRGARTSAASFS